MSKFNLSREYEESRPRIEIKASEKVTIDGKLKLIFSEPLMSEKEFIKRGFNLTKINEIRHKIMNLTYIVNDEDFEFKKPVLLDWTIVDWEWYYMTIQMNFSFPLYISDQPRINDEI